MGVQMMLQGGYENAANTLKDALTILSLMLHCRQDTPPEQVEQLLQERLQRATTRLSQKHSKTTLLLHPVVSAVESNDFQSLKTASLRPRNDTPKLEHLSFSAVLIREPGMNGGDEESVNFDRESGIVLYNFGLACFLLAAFTNNKKKSQQYQTIEEDETLAKKLAGFERTAHKSLLLAHSSFSKIIMACEDAADDLESVFLDTLVLSCSSQIYRVRHQLEKAQEVDEAMDSILMAIEDEYVSALIQNEVVAAAAA
uniref:Uncharacterized protein n=1 Tax=Entomoneis paludosa TaxID=265537 RepID=A0A7S2YSK5_9STRA